MERIIFQLRDKLIKFHTRVPCTMSFIRAFPRISTQNGTQMTLAELLFTPQGLMFRDMILLKRPSIR